MEIDMDWKLDQKKREKKQAMIKAVSAESANILGEMEREFTHIFGGTANAGFFRNRGKAGDPVRRNESSAQYKSQKAD
jgi:hypothetical protein